jgi:hypothetical protein
VPKLSNAHFQKDCGVVKSQRSPTIGESLWALLYSYSCKKCHFALIEL